MAADLNVHVWDENAFGEDVLKVFFHNHLGHRYSSGLFGSWNIAQTEREEQKIKDKYGEEPYQLVADTPAYHCGETSPLKAAVFDDDKYLYGMDKYFEVFESAPLLIDAELIKKCAFDPKLQTFLRKYKGKQAFTVCW